MSTAEIQVWVSDTTTGDPIPDAPIDIVDGDFPAPEDGRTNQDGFASFTVKTGRSYLVEVHADGYDSVQKTISLPQSEADKRFLLTRTGPTPIPPQPTPGGLSPIVGIEGFRFKLQDGKAFFGRVCSDFMLYYRYLIGEDIEPVLAQRAEFGFTVCRVFGMAKYVPENDLHWPAFKPQDFPDYYDEFPLFTEQLHTYGLRPYYSEFPDVQFIMPNESDQLRHHDKMRVLVTDLFELTNEADAHEFNRVDVPKFSKPTCQSCAGSYGEGLHPYYWDFYDFHPRRVYPAQITDQCLANNPNQEAGRKGGLGENDRLDGDRRNDAFQIGGTGMGTALFTSFHCTQGKKSEVFTGDTVGTALAFLSGQLR